MTRDRSLADATPVTLPEPAKKGSDVHATGAAVPAAELQHPHTFPVPSLGSSPKPWQLPGGTVWQGVASALNPRVAPYRHSLALALALVAAMLLFVPLVTILLRNQSCRDTCAAVPLQVRLG